MIRTKGPAHDGWHLTPSHRFTTRVNRNQKHLKPVMMFVNKLGHLSRKCSDRAKFNHKLVASRTCDLNHIVGIGIGLELVNGRFLKIYLLTDKMYMVNRDLAYGKKN